MPYARVNGFRLWYVEHEAPGDHVLLIMGLRARGKGWELLAEHLKGAYHVVWFDNRGAGKSERPPGLYRMDQFAGDSVQLMDHLGWERAHIVGVSMGGMIAQHIGLTYPQRVKSLALLATHAGGPQTWFPTRAAMRRWTRFAFGTREEKRESVLELLYPDAVLAGESREQLKHRLLVEFGEEVDIQTLISHLAAVLRHDVEDELHRLRSIPTLIVQPGHDIIIRPEESERLHNCIPGSQLVQFDEAGHGLIRQCPEKLAAILSEHFEKAMTSPNVEASAKPA